MIAYASQRFVALEGTGRLGSAIEQGATLVRATLLAEADEKIGDLTCSEYVHAFG
jgi:hypothetical protein